MRKNLCAWLLLNIRHHNKCCRMRVLKEDAAKSARPFADQYFTASSFSPKYNINQRQTDSDTHEQQSK